MVRCSIRRCEARVASGACVRERRYGRRMDGPCSAASGQAEVEQVFTLVGRGLILALKDGFGGTIPANGTVQGELGASAYTGPTFVEDWDASGTWRGWTAVVARADAVHLFRPGDKVTFLPRSSLGDGHRTVRTIELDAQGWSTALDFYEALLAAIGAPAWHGMSIDALIDSMVWGGINSVEPPYEVLIHEVQGLADNARQEVGRAEQAIEMARTDFVQRRGHDPGVSLKVIS